MSESEELSTFAPMWIDTLLAEALPYENATRLASKNTLLEVAPHIPTLEENIPYCDDICRIALPYGLASQFFINEDNMYMAQDFRARFISALEDISKAQEESVVDSYA